MKEESFAWFAGVDWGSEHHQVCLVDAQGRIVGEREFPHGGKGLADLCDWLLSICGAANSVAVGIEVPHGPVVDTLIDRGFVLHAINPKQLDRLRDRHSVAGAKDDRRDAYVLGDGVRTDRRLFRRLHVADPRLVELRAWSRLAEELTQERVRLGNRAHHELWRYYPQVLKIADDDVAAPWVLDESVQTLGVETFSGPAGDLVRAEMPGLSEVRQAPVASHTPKVWTVPVRGRDSGDVPGRRRHPDARFPGAHQAIDHLAEPAADVPLLGGVLGQVAVLVANGLAGVLVGATVFGVQRGARAVLAALGIGHARNAAEH